MYRLVNSMKRCLVEFDRRRSYRVFDRAIFILSAPRSGSTYLFDLLCRFPGVWARSVETDDIWWHHFPYERSEDPSDHVGGEEYDPQVASRLRRDLYRHALWSQEEGRRCSFRERAGLSRVRYVDKTIANCFHLGFLKRAFPDAMYILLIRDGRATISSMMEGWHVPERFVKPQLTPFLRECASPLSHWAYPAPPGWREAVHSPLEQLCAWSWRQHVETAHLELQDIPQDRKLLVRYEELTRRPQALAREIGTFCGLTWDDRVASFAEENPLSRTTVSAPDPDKWRRLHGEQIDRVLPIIQQTMANLSLTVDCKFS